jgi:dihydroorotase-like cyclic amidohydrolase
MIKVHFKNQDSRTGDIESESRAAVAGGITLHRAANTVPNAVTQEILEQSISWQRTTHCELFIHDGRH